MKIVFMGTPEFAIPSLNELLKSKHEVIAVVSGPDKERGRGRQISFTPIKEFALKHDVEVLNPFSLHEEEFINRLKELEPDLFIIVAFRILPKEVYTIPKYGSFNLHGSLLPKYRGAAPIQWALINGDKETGVTTFFLEDKVDTGNIILQEKIAIENDDDYGSLYEKMMALGANTVIKTVEMIEAQNFNLTSQEDLLASPAPKISKELCQINWNKSAEEIHNLVRGLSPYPSAYFAIEGTNYKVFKTLVLNNTEHEKLEANNSLYAEFYSQSPGKIFQTKKEIFVKTGNGVLQILDLQPEGRKRMNAEDFLRGNSLLD
jgi:methionyl-tRNA formyltransferase